MFLGLFLDEANKIGGVTIFSSWIKKPGGRFIEKLNDVSGGHESSVDMKKLTVTRVCKIS